MSVQAAAQNDVTMKIARNACLDIKVQTIQTKNRAELGGRVERDDLLKNYWVETAVDVLITAAWLDPEDTRNIKQQLATDSAAVMFDQIKVRRRNTQRTRQFCLTNACNRPSFADTASS